ncbi:hypothetical protein LCGC14_2879410, partial [marine sediment metagenome]
RVSTTFQERVISGELTVEKATAIGQQALDIELGKISKDISGLGGEQLFETTGKRISRGVKTGIALAPILVAPLTPSISLRAAAGIGSQAFSIKAGQESLEAFQRGDFLVGGLKTAEAGAFAFGGGQLIRGALGPTRSLISGQIEGIRLAELQGKPFSLGGAELLTGPRGVVTELSLSKVVPGATQEVGALIPTFRQGEQAFSIAGGRLVSTTRIQPFAAGEPILKFKDISSFIGKGDIGVGGRLVGPASSVEISEGISTSVGKITVPRGEQAITTGFGGISQRGDDIINIISGRPFQRAGPTFKIAPTTAGQIKIKQKDIIDIGGRGPSVSNGGVGRIIPGQGQVTQFIGTGTQVRTTRDIVGGSIQAGIRAAEVGGAAAIQQAGIAQFVP